MLRRSSLNLTNNVLSAFLLVVAVAGAVALVWLSEMGGLDMAVFVTVAALVTIAALISNEFGLFALIFVASIDGFLKALSPGWHTQLLKDYILGICLLRWAWLSVLGNRRESMRLPVSLPLLIFAGWIGVQLLNTRSESLLISLAGFRMWTIWLPTFFLAYDTFDSREKIERLLLYLMGLMVPLAIYGIIQYEIGLDHLFRLAPGFGRYEWAAYAGSEGDEWRPPSTMISPHALADTLTMVMLMAIGFGIYYRRNRLVQIGILASVPIMGVGMLITAVRNAAGSAVLGAAALLLIRRRFDLAVLVAIVGSIAVYQVDAITGGQAMNRIRTIVENPQYTRGRILGPWRAAARFAVENPFGGGIATGTAMGRVSVRGLNVQSFDPENQLPFIENEYGRSLLELGIPGFILFLWMLFVVTRSNYRSYQAAVEVRDRWLIAGLFAACVSILARLLVGPALYGWPEAPLFWYYTAVAARLPLIERQEEMKRQTPDTEARATILGDRKLPWARTEDRR